MCAGKLLEDLIATATMIILLGATAKALVAHRAMIALGRARYMFIIHILNWLTYSICCGLKFPCQLAFRASDFICQQTQSTLVVSTAVGD